MNCLFSRSNMVITCTAMFFPFFRDKTFFTHLSTYRCDCFHDNLEQLGVTYPYTDSKQLSTYFSKLSEMNVFPRRKPKSLHRLGIYSKILLIHSYGQKAEHYLTLKAPITTKVVCYCRLLKCFEAYWSNSVDPDPIGAVWSRFTLFASTLTLAKNCWHSFIRAESRILLNP